MPKTDILINNLNGGELDPQLDARADINKYYSGCRKLENFVPLVEGGATRTPGTYFLVETKDSSKKSRLVPFSYSTIESYHLEFGDQYIRFYKDKGQIIVDDSMSDFDPSEAQYNGRHVKVGAYITLDFGSSKKLYVAAPYGLTGANTIKVAVSTNSSDVLAVTTATDTITIKLANSTSSRNAAHLIQNQIRNLVTANGVSVVGFTVTENTAYATARPITGTIAAALLVAHDRIYRCLVSIDDPGANLTEYSITNVTKANPGVVSATSHPFINMDMVHITEIAGMTELNGNDYGVGTILAGVTFQLYTLAGAALDTSAYTTYVSGGKVKSVNPNTNYFPTAEATYWVLVTLGSAVEIITPYLEADIFKVSKNPQSADILYLFHPSYAPRKLIRHSHIDWELTQYQPIGTEGIAKTGALGIAKQITYISKANPAVVTCREHGFQDGETVYINHVLGMIQVNGNVYTVSQPGTHTFKLLDTDSTGFDTFYVDSSGEKNGTAVKVVDLFGSVGDYPSCGSFFEQRISVGGMTNDPAMFKLSMSAEYEKFISDPDLDDGSIEFTLASRKVDTIRWMEGKELLFLGTAGGIWRVGAMSQADAFTQANLDVKKVDHRGVLDIEPQVIGDSLIWISRGGVVLRKTSFSIEANNWISHNLMRIASHIAKGSTQATSGIVEMAYQQEPIPILWCIRKDGELLGLTYEAEENIYAWFRVVTDGLFESVSVISNDNEEDQVWVIVNRTIENVTNRYIEYFMPFEWFSEVKDFFYVHSGLTWDGGSDINITGITKASPPVVTAPGHTFVNGNKISITEVLGMTEVNIDVDEAYQVANVNLGAGTFELQGQDSSTWGVYTSGGVVRKVTNTISSGLSHLQGETVKVIIDGALHDDEVVTGGAISLDFYGNKIHIGLPYTSTCTPSKIHAGDVSNTSRNKKQKISKLRCIFRETIGGKYGPDEDNLEDIPFESDETPTLHTEDKDAQFHQYWTDAATLCIIQNEPLPMTILGIIPRFHIED